MTWSAAHGAVSARRIGKLDLAVKSAAERRIPHRRGRLRSLLPASLWRPLRLIHTANPAKGRLPR
jgi:hypothetical protein